MIRGPGALAGAALLLAATAAGAAEELRVTARAAPEVVGIDQVVRFTIEVEGRGIGSRRFEPQFELDNLEIDAGPSSSQSFSFVNGVASRSESLSWILRPLEIGSAGIRSIRVRLGERVYEPPDVAVEVQDEPVADGSQQPRGRLDPFEDFFPPLTGRLRRGRPPPPELFLRAEIDPRDPWVGQQAIYTLYLYTQAHISSINPESLPDFNGFWVRDIELPEPAEVEMVDVDGKRFGRVPVLRRAIFPLRAGELRLEPARVQLSVRVPDRTFGSLLSGIDQVRRDSNPLQVTARELPDGAPAGFGGAVGDLAVTSRLEPPTVDVGDAATFEITLEGAGHLQGLPAPELAPIEGVRIFPPQQEAEEAVSGSRVRGRRTWSYVLVPETAGRYTLPPFEMPYFDPAAGAYRVARSEPTALEARPVAAAATPPPAAVPPTAEESGRPPAPPSSLSWTTVAPWGLAGLLGAGLALTWWQKRNAPTGGRGDAGRALEAALEAAGEQPSPRRAAALLEQGWREFLEQRWEIAPGTASTQWAARLEEAGAPRQPARELVALADDLHYLRYAPQLADTDTLTRELILRSKKLRRSLE